MSPCWRRRATRASGGGEGSGKSHFFGELAIETAILRPGFRCVCIREVQKSLEQSVKRLLELKIAAMGVGHLFEVQERVIKCPGNGLILFQGMQNHTAESIKSLEGYDVAWVEEAQSISQRSLDLLRPTIRKPGSELWFSWNPNFATDPVDTLLRGTTKRPGSIVVEANYTENPWFPDVLREEMEWDRSRDADKYAHIWLGGYQKNSEARVFKNWRTDEIEIPPEARAFYGADWGFSVDPTVLVRVWIWGRTLYIDAEAYKVGCEIDALPDLFDTVDGARGSQIVADSARPETISYLNRHGFNVQPATKGKGSVEDGVAFLKSHDIVVHPRCRHASDELALYSYKQDRLTGAVLTDLDDANNHVIDSLRYALESSRTSFDPNKWIKAFE